MTTDSSTRTTAVGHTTDEVPRPARETARPAGEGHRPAGEPSPVAPERDAPPRRLRSSTVVLGGMGVLAMALAACGSDPDRRCVDRDSYTVDGYKVLGSKDCKPSGGGTHKSTATARDAAAARPAWYYGADVHGTRAQDGTFSRDGAIQRGGLGCDDDDDDGSSGG